METELIEPVRFATYEEERKYTNYINEYLRRQLTYLKRVYGEKHHKIQTLEQQLAELMVFNEDF